MRVPPVLAVLLAAAALPSAAAAAPCDRPPVGVSLSSSDPTVLQDDARAIVSPRRGRAVSDVRVSVRRDGRVYATGAFPGRLAPGRTAVALRLAAGHRIRAGAYRVVATARRAGCSARAAATRTWRFGTPSLPVRAAPMSTLVQDNRDGVRLLLRSVGRRRVAGVRVRLLDAQGDTVAQAARARAFAGQATVDLPVAGTLSPGRYTLRVTGRSGDARAVSEQPLVFGGGSSATPAPTVSGGGGDGPLVQHAVVDWSSGAWQGRDVAGFVAPGIGYGEIVCNPDAQWIRFYPNDLGREVSMMNWTYKDWTQYREKSIREALHAPGTGPDFREGLNKFGPTEKQSTGEFDGLISDRGPFGNVGGVPLANPTSLRLTWQWDLTQGATARCHVEATFTSGEPSNSIAWRGDGNAPPNDHVSFPVPGLGTVALSCEPGPLGNRSLSVDTAGGAVVTTREGSDDVARPQDAGPVGAQLPNNGMVSIRFAGGATLLVASRWKVNDPDPAQNACFVAAQAIPAGA